MNIFEKLQAVQSELKAPKGQYNSFGKYKYRSCEDILEAAKPVLAKHKSAITISDKIVMIGDRYYIEATARFYDTESEHDPIENTAYAREAGDKKGMDESQITGTASSYARKYCLNGLLLIDDTKDTDTEENHIEVKERAETKKKQEPQQEQASGGTIPGYPDRQTMLDAIYPKYPRGSSVYNALIAALGVSDLDDASDVLLVQAYKKVLEKRRRDEDRNGHTGTDIELSHAGAGQN